MIEWLQFYLLMLPVAELIITLFASVFFDGIGSGVIRIIIIGVLYKHNLALTAAGNIPIEYTEIAILYTWGIFDSDSYVLQTGLSLIVI